MANGCDESCGTHVRMASAAGCVYHVMQQLTMGRELKILQLHWLHFNICELPDALAARIATKRQPNKPSDNTPSLCDAVSLGTKRHEARHEARQSRRDSAPSDTASASLDVLFLYKMFNSTVPPFSTQLNAPAVRTASHRRRNQYHR